MRLCSALIALVGCDTQFHLVEVPPYPTPDMGSTAHTYIAEGDTDGDGVDNAQDPCPFDPDNTPDLDADGVADTCDPRPDTPGDCIVFFEDFRNNRALDGRWQTVADAGGTWTKKDCTGDGKNALCSPLPSSLGYAYFDEPFELSVIRVKANIIGIGTADKDVSLTAFDALEPSGGDVTGRACGAGRDAPDAHGVVILDDLVDGTASVVQHDPAPFGPDISGAITILWKASDGACQTFDGSTIATATLSARGAAPPGQFPGVRIAHIDAAVRSIVGYGASCE